MPRAKPSTPASLRPPSRPLRTTLAALALLLTLTLAAALIARPHINLPNVVAERSAFVEPAQPILWLAAAAAATIACITQRPRRGVLLALWIATISTLAGLRELDLHALLNPENIHQLAIHPDNAVRFRIDWWLADGPAAARLAWAAAFLALAALATLPFALARYPWPAKLRKRDTFATLTAASLALAAAAWLLDDILARIPGVTASAVRHAEETTELISPLLMCIAAATLALRTPNLARPQHAEVTFTP